MDIGQAIGGGLLEAVTGGISPGGLVVMALGWLLLTFIQEFLSPLVSQLFSWSLDYTTIPVFNMVITTLQGISIAAAVAIRVAIGVKDKILLGGGDREQSSGEYVFRSIMSVVVVALMPTLCAGIIELGHSLYNFITGMTDHALESQLSYFTFDGIDAATLFGSNVTSTAFWLVVGALAIMILTVCCGYQFMRRQVEMIVISVIGPVVSVYAATENETDEVAVLLRNLFGLCCVQWLQYILVSAALGCGKGWMSVALSAFASGGSYAVFGDAGSAQAFLFCVAFFGAALTVPKLVDNYTYGSGGSGGGRMVLGAIVGTAIRSTTRLPGGGGKFVKVK